MFQIIYLISIIKYFNKYDIFLLFINLTYIKFFLNYNNYFKLFLLLFNCLKFIKKNFVFKYFELKATINWNLCGKK